jgi:hypothetical protein
VKSAGQNPCRFFTNRAGACPCPLYAGTTPLSTDLEALKLPAVCSDYPLDGNNSKGAGTIEQKNGESSRLVLGFDAGCITCSEVVKRVEEQVGERLEVRDLRDPDVTRWIKDVLVTRSEGARMEPHSPRPLRHKLLPGIFGVGCVAGTLFGVLNGLYLLALSQIFFAAAMALIFFEAEGRSKFFGYLTWACLGVGILVTAVAASV